MKENFVFGECCIDKITRKDLAGIESPAATPIPFVEGIKPLLLRYI